MMIREEQIAEHLQQSVPTCPPGLHPFAPLIDERSDRGQTLHNLVDEVSRELLCQESSTRVLEVSVLGFAVEELFLLGSGVLHCHLEAGHMVGSSHRAESWSRGGKQDDSRSCVSSPCCSNLPALG